LIYVSSAGSGTAGGVSFADEDILAYDNASGTWSLYFDGSDVGLGGVDVNAFALMPDGSILLSVDAALSISGLGTVDDSDIVRFIPATLGDTTSGTFEWYFDGSDVGLTTSGEDVDAIDFAPDGRLVISTTDIFSVTGASGGDEDLIAFSATSLGSTTSGTWSQYFDGSDVGLADTANEDVNGLWISDISGQIYLSTLGAFLVPGVSGDGADIFVCIPGSLGTNTSCTYDPDLYWDGSLNGFAGQVLDGFDVVPFTGATSTPTATSTNTLTPTNTLTSTPTYTITPSNTPTFTATSTLTFTATVTNTTTYTPTSTFTSVPVNTSTDTPIPPTSTETPIPPTSTNTATNTSTSVPTNTFTSTVTIIPPTSTDTSIPPTNTNIPTSTFTATNTPISPTATNTLTATSTPTITSTSTNTLTATNTFIPPTATFTFTPTNTSTSTPVPTVSVITIGEASILTTDDYGNGNLLISQQADLSQSATIQSLSFYVGTTGGQLRLGIYSDNNGNPGTLLAQTAAFTPTTGWNTQNVQTPVLLPAGTYWLTYLPQSNNLHFRIGFTGSARGASYTFGTLPGNFPGSPMSADIHWSFYATLTK